MRFEALDASGMDQIHEGTLTLLSATGTVFHSRQALKAFAEAGADVDFDRHLVKLNRGLVEHALAKASGRFRLWRRGGDGQIDLMDGTTRGHNVGGCIHVIDEKTGLVRDACQSDLERLTVLIDALDNIHVCRPVAYPQEYPAAVRDVLTAATMIRLTEKPYGVSAYSPENQKIILRLADVVAGGRERLVKRPFVWGSICPISPLTYTESTADILIGWAAAGLPVAIAPCPICGGSSPVTLAGTLVQQNAEFLAGLVLAHIIRPGIDVKYTSRPIPMDMRSGLANFGAIEMGLMSAGVVQLAKRYGVCSDVYGLGTSSLNLDERAGYEKAMNGLLPALAGADLIAACGMLDNALTSNAEQLVIDNEMLAMIFRALRGIAITPDTLALDLIARVGPKGDFLSNPHTVQFMREELLVPRLSARAAQGRGSEDSSLLGMARRMSEEILRDHAPASLPKDMVSEIESILAPVSRKSE